MTNNPDVNNAMAEKESRSKITRDSMTITIECAYQYDPVCNPDQPHVYSWSDFTVWGSTKEEAREELVAVVAQGLSKLSGIGKY
jgi:hypothetical protein